MGSEINLFEIKTLEEIKEQPGNTDISVEVRDRSRNTLSVSLANLQKSWGFQLRKRLKIPDSQTNHTVLRGGLWKLPSKSIMMVKIGVKFSGTGTQKLASEIKTEMRVRNLEVH